MANEMWGGRFAEGPAAIMQEINASISFDKRLADQDIRGSMAQAEMLAAQGIIDAQSAEAIIHGLKEVKAEIDAGTFTFRTSLEDIHMNVEARLAEIIGTPAGRLHTARSRNDQVATDFRLYVRDAIDMIDASLKDLQKALAEKALVHAGTVMPGFTHLQSAQPVTFGHHMLAYVQLFGRDRGRFADALWLIGWMQAITTLMLAVQVVAMLLLPGLNMAFAMVSIAVSLWVLVGYLCALHGFASRIAVLMGIVGVFVALSMALSVLLILLGYDPSGALDV